MAFDILIVDDEADIRMLVADILEDEGYACRVAAGSDSALKAVEERLPGGLALVSLAVERGARLLRVHDVGPSVDAINMTWAVLQEDADR